MLLGIIRTRYDFCCEVLDANNLIFLKMQLAHLVNVEPLIGAIFDGSIIEVEAIHINDGFQVFPLFKTAEAAKPPRTPPRKNRGNVLLL